MGPVGSCDALSARLDRLAANERLLAAWPTAPVPKRPLQEWGGVTLTKLKRSARTWRAVTPQGRRLCCPTAAVRSRKAPA